MTDEIAALRARLEAAEARSVRLAEAIARWGYWKDKGGRERCYCSGDADCLDRHEELCDLMNAALAEHDALGRMDAAVKGEG